MTSYENFKWEGKSEPSSPFFSDPDDLWLFEDNLAQVHTLIEHAQKEDLKPYLQNISKAEMAEQLLRELDEIKEEPFSQWLEEKMDLPLFEELPVPLLSRPFAYTPDPIKAYYMKPYAAPLSPPLALQQVGADDTQTLLREFETVYGAVEFNHLTPPQSPPAYGGVGPCSPSLNDLASIGISQNLVLLQPAQQYRQGNNMYLNVLPQTKAEPSFKTFEPMSQSQQNGLLYSVHSEMNGYDISSVAASPQPDLVRELAVVDELVRSRALDIPEDVKMQWTDTDSVGSSHSSSPRSEYVLSDSPTVEPNNEWFECKDVSLPSGSLQISCPKRSPSPTSSSSSSYAASEADDEWIPEPVKSPRGPTKSPKKRSAKPYTRPVEEKKSRKKEQNKNAATRYRQKKKAEIEEILGEEKELMDKNDELKTQCSDVAREIKYLKGLMKDLLKAKGLI